MAFLIVTFGDGE